MELRQLRAVLAIAQTGSVTKAAELLHVVQPAISRQLRQIEQDLGKPLFQRVHNGMEPTPEGLLLIDHARRALLSLDKAVAEIKPSRGEVAGLVSIGLLPSVCDLLAVDLLKAVQCAYPQIHLRLSTGYPGQLQQLMEEGSLDMALLYHPRPIASVDMLPLLDEPLHLVGLPDSGMDWSTGAKPLSVLRNLPLILPSSVHTVRGILEHICAIQRIPLNIVAEVDATQLTRLFLAAGVAYTVLPGVAIADFLARGDLAIAPLDHPALQRRISLATTVTRRNSVAVRHVCDLLRENVQKLVRAGRWPGARLVDFAP
ncbi:LysR family regulatory protein [Bordetella ansorpii]|uniref:LysR family regulatory protein n=1 Tax=Bordetella ansorpii TaxID=288768 RepID=A0A157RHZ2_9BORD|nr:LysR family transcriptional regulator [Bordetella ansorpii]SAI57546.1 LysR family regulatory protein [Bordetella ansorpii]